MIFVATPGIYFLCVCVCPNGVEGDWKVPFCIASKPMFSGGLNSFL